ARAGARLGASALGGPAVRSKAPRPSRAFAAAGRLPLFSRLRMLTRRQRLELWIAALLCLLVGLVALWIYAILREPSPTRTAGPHRPRLPESAPVVSELPDEITPEIAPAAIPIRIFCFDGNGRPAG